MGIVTMERPELLDSIHIHQQKQAALEQIAPIEADKVSVQSKRGQYIGYRQEVNNPVSTTETFAQITVYSDSERWKGVPIKLLTGKSLDELKTEIRVTFKQTGQSDNRNFVFDFLKKGHPNAYERVLVDAFRGDHTLFATSQEILASWRIVQPVLDAWSKSSDDLQFYEPGSTGPTE